MMYVKVIKTLLTSSNKSTVSDIDHQMALQYFMKWGGGMEIWCLNIELMFLGRWQS
jgi:hypothetical protein